MSKRYHSHTFQEYTADGDIPQGAAVYISGSNITTTTAGTDQCIGLAERAVEDGDDKISVVTSGRFDKARIGATLSEGDVVTGGADGDLVAVTTDDYRVATLLMDAADTDVGVRVEVYANKSVEPA